MKTITENDRLCMMADVIEQGRPGWKFDLSIWGGCDGRGGICGCIATWAIAFFDGVEAVRKLQFGDHAQRAAKILGLTSAEVMWLFHGMFTNEFGTVMATCRPNTAALAIRQLADMKDRGETVLEVPEYRGGMFTRLPAAPVVRPTQAPVPFFEAIRRALIADPAIRTVTTRHGRYVRTDDLVAPRHLEDA